MSGEGYEGLEREPKGRGRLAGTGAHRGPSFGFPVNSFDDDIDLEISRNLNKVPVSSFGSDPGFDDTATGAHLGNVDHFLAEPQEAFPRVSQGNVDVQSTQALWGSEDTIYGDIQEAGLFRNFDVSTFVSLPQEKNPRIGGDRRVPLTDDQRREARLMRQIGVCWACKMRKMRCDPGEPCKSTYQKYSPVPIEMSTCCIPHLVLMCARYKMREEQRILRPLS